MKHPFAVLVVLLGATTFVSAKGLTTRIEVTSAQFHAPVDITDPEILKSFNVCSVPGPFVNGVEGIEGVISDWPLGALQDRRKGLISYEVSFYVKYVNRPASEQEDQLAYKVLYAIDPSSGAGYVYLPGKSDEPYRLNVKAIFHGREGNWFHATAAWQRAVDTLVAQAR